MEGSVRRTRAVWEGRVLTRPCRGWTSRACRPPPGSPSPGLSPLLVPSLLLLVQQEQGSFMDRHTAQGRTCHVWCHMHTPCPHHGTGGFRNTTIPQSVVTGPLWFLCECVPTRAVAALVFLLDGSVTVAAAPRRPPRLDVRTHRGLLGPPAGHPHPREHTPPLQKNDLFSLDFSFFFN